MHSHDVVLLGIFSSISVLLHERVSKDSITKVADLVTKWGFILVAITYRAHSRNFSVHTCMNTSHTHVRSMLSDLPWIVRTNTRLPRL